MEEGRGGVLLEEGRETGLPVVGGREGIVY